LNNEIIIPKSYIQSVPNVTSIVKLLSLIDTFVETAAFYLNVAITLSWAFLLKIGIIYLDSGNIKVVIFVFVSILRLLPAYSKNQDFADVIV